MLDLAQLDTTTASEEGAVLEVCHPSTQEPLLQDDGRPVTIRLAGTDSERYQRIARLNLNRRLKAQRLRSGRNAAEITAEDLDRERLEQLVGCTIEWDGVVLDGQPIVCSAENARQVYTRIRWLREQAEDFQNDRANFLNGSLKT